MLVSPWTYVTKGLCSRLILEKYLIKKMKTFRELGLSDEFVSELEKAKITIPSEIQEKAIPLVLTGRDIVGGSATGSGKTLAFASSIIENLEQNGNIQALILTPTRELAEQVANAITKFSRHKRLNVLPIYGGIGIDRQIRLLQKTDIVVGTPGRILDHLSRQTLDLEKVKFLVLDEVDRMFDMGFQRDVEKILKKCPKKRQTMLFSATISSTITHLAEKHTKQPVKISVESHLDASKLKQIYYDVPDSLKFSLFVDLLKKEESNLVMVFCGTRRNVDFVTNNLNHLGIYAKAIHGGMVQVKRNKVMNEFNSTSGVNVLVCTDVAARGLDIKGVSHVYNYDLPKTSEDYIHRIGRTARAGKEGIAINILCSRDYENFGNILRDEKLKIEEVKAPRFERVQIIVEGRNKQRNSDNSHKKDFSRGRSSGRPRNDRPRSHNNSRRDSSSGRDSPKKHQRGKPGKKNYSRSKPTSSRENYKPRTQNPRRGNDRNRRNNQGRSKRRR